MKNTTLFLILILISNNLFSQAPNPDLYYQFTSKADSMYKAKDFKNSAFTYSLAFKEYGWKGLINDRYKAACSWALAKYPDSAFYHLDKIVSKGFYTDYEHITKDNDLVSLHNDKRWQPLINAIKLKKQKQN